MVEKSSKWLLLLAALSNVAVASGDLGVRLNREIKTAVQRVHEAGRPVVISSNVVDTKPLADYGLEEDEMNAEEVAFEAQRSSLVEKLRTGTATIQDVQGGLANGLFPVRSELTPTKLPSREVVLSHSARARFVQPMAVIGNDELSVAWFKLNVEELRRVKATVIVTEVDNAEEFAAIRGLAPDLIMMPIRADVMLREVGVNVYPIVLTAANAYQ